MSNSWQHIRVLWRAAGDRPRPSKASVRVLRRHFAEDGVVERMARFERFMTEAARDRFVWGVCDCSLVLADWAMANGHDDSAEDLRGAYDSKAGCQALVDARGGLATVIGACAAQLRLAPLQEPELGAVAVIGSASQPSRQWGAIWNGARWAIWWGDEHRASWQPMMAPPLAIWRI